MPRGKRHSDETRAAVIAALLSGQGVNEVAAAFNLDSGMVSRWKAAIPEQQLQQVAVEKKERLVDLIESHLLASFKAAIAIANQANDDIWRKDQPAGELAVFYGVLSDKSFKLIEVAGKLFAEAEKPETPE